MDASRPRRFLNWFLAARPRQSLTRRARISASRPRRFLAYRAKLLAHNPTTSGSLPPDFQRIYDFGKNKIVGPDHRKYHTLADPWKPPA